MVVRSHDINILTLNDFPILQPNFAICSLETYQQEYAGIFQGNRRSFYTIVYLQDQDGHFQVDLSSIYLQSGELLNISPHSVSTFHINKKAKGWLLMFDKTFFSKRFNDNVLLNYNFLKGNTVCRMLPEPQKLDMLFCSMLEESQGNAPDAQNLLRSYLNILLGILERHSHRPFDAPHNNENEHRMIRFEQLLEEKFTKERFPSFYADKLSISANYLNRICKDRRGLSSGELIRNRISQEAERLLYHTYKTISEISFELGFDNVSYFITFFKKKHGISPEEFRKSHN